MLTVRNGFVAPLLIVATLFAGAAIADDQGKKDAAMDMNARMQQKLNSKLGASIGGGELDIESKLADRVDEKNAETNKQLDDQASAVTAADRSGGGEEEGREADAEE